MPLEKKSISVVLPNYNGKHLLEQYIPSVIDALQYSKIDHEIIMIDDCSKDDSVAFLAGNFPDVKVLKNESNVGFSKTCNKGIMAATKDLVFLLNTDVKLTNDFFEAQFKYFENADTFGVMGCIMNFDGKKIEDAARMPRYKGGKFKANTFFYSENKDDLVYTTYLSGANALIDRKKIVEIGGFNELYSPFYFEDFDLGLRAWQMGWKLYYEHQSVCYHRVSASTNNMNKSNFVKITYNRNSFLLQAIHLKGFKRKLWHFQLFTSTLLGHLLKGEFWILESIKAFLKIKTAIQKSISDIQKLQNDKQITFDLDSIIEIQKNNYSKLNIKWL